MIPAIRPGDWVWARPPRALARGRLVVVRKTELFVKRVVGLPGEQVDLRNGRVLVNGRRLSEPYVQETAFLEPMADGSWTLGAQDYLVLGDARDDSLDSRRWGPVPKNEIVGVLAWRLWPKISAV